MMPTKTDDDDTKLLCIVNEGPPIAGYDENVERTMAFIFVSLYGVFVFAIQFIRDNHCIHCGP